VVIAQRLPNFRIRIDESQCIGAGRCVIAAPDLFDQRESDGVVMVMTQSPAPDAYDRAVKAAAQCPARVIEIVAI